MGRKAKGGADAGGGSGGGGAVGPVELLAVEAIEPSPLNRRIPDDDEKLAALAKSIGAHGLQTPISVRPHPDGRAGKYEIICGERRWRACRALGHQVVAAMVKDVDDRRAQLERLIENTDREDLTPIEEGQGVAALLDLHNDDVREVAERLDKSEGWVRRRARLPYLSEKWLAALAGDGGEYETIRRSVTCMEELSLLPATEQDMLLESRKVQYCDSVSDVRRVIHEWLRRLDTRPWPEEFAGGGKACAGCMSRSDRDGDLFAPLREEAGDPAAAYCLDSRCWRDKSVAWVKSILDKTPGAVALVDGWHSDEAIAALRAGLGGRRVAEFSEWEELGEDDDENAPPDNAAFHTGVVCVGKRIGETIRVFVDAEDDDDGEEDEAAAAEREREWEERNRKAEADRQRRRAEARAQRKAMDALLPKTWALGDYELVAMAAWFGLNAVRWKKDVPKTLGGMRDFAGLRDEVWQQLRQTIVRSVDNEYCPMPPAERKGVCEFLGLEWKDVAAAAKAALAKKAGKGGKAGATEDGDGEAA